MNDYLKAYIDSFGSYREQESEPTYTIPVKEFESLKAERDEARKERDEAVNYQIHLQRGWGQANAERDAARLEVEQVAESRLRWYENFRSMANQRDEARAEAANWKPIGIDACWKDHADTLQKQLDEALADVEKLNNIVDKWMKAYESVREEAAMYHTQRDEADETADFWEAQFDDAQANLAKAYAELSNRTLDSLDSDDAIGSEPLLVVFTFGGLD